MKKILVIGAGGQIGSDLIPILRKKYGNDNVISAGYENDLPSYIKDNGPHTYIDVRN